MMENNEFNTNILGTYSSHSQGQDEISEDVSQSISASGNDSFSTNDKSVLDQSSTSLFSQSNGDSKQSFAGGESCEA
jgi:hypothetical protein